MKCLNCNYENEMSSKYCSNCGFSLEEKTKKNITGYLILYVLTFIVTIYSLVYGFYYLLLWSLFGQLMFYSGVDLQSILFFIAPYIIAIIWIGLLIFLLKFFKKRMK